MFKIGQKVTIGSGEFKHYKAKILAIGPTDYNLELLPISLCDKEILVELISANPQIRDVVFVEARQLIP